MPLEAHRRLILSEWRIVLVSQTSYPLMYKIERPVQSEHGLQWIAAGYAVMKIPLGGRIITKWQEQVRPMENNDNQWYVVREWTEAEIARDYNRVKDAKEEQTTASRVQDRTQVHRILSEIGLNPNDFIFSPLPRDSPTQEPTSNHTSAFSNYPSQPLQRDSQTSTRPQSQALITADQATSYILQTPPARPPPSTVPLASGPSLLNRDQSSSTLQPPTNHRQTSSQSESGLPLPSHLLNRSAHNTENTASEPSQDTNQRMFLSRRSPPPPPNFDSCYNDSNLSAEHYLSQINSQDIPPVKVVKPSTQNVVYRKEIRIRYLQPPTPPPPAPIIIREKHTLPDPPQSPLLIRERKPAARTPPPLTIRERPPTPLPLLEPYIIDKNLPPPPPQPRQIIVERLPTPPPKPRTVIFEKWLPYKKLKRPVLLQKAPPQEPIKPTRNVVIEYEPLKAFTVRRVIEEGVFRVDPHQSSSYNTQSHSSSGDVRIVERIEDLPPPSEQLMRVLDDYNQHSSPRINTHDHQSHQNLSEYIPSPVQHLLTGGQPTANTDHLTDVSRASSTPAYKQERVLSTGYNSSVPSPTIVPLQHSHSKHLGHPIHQYPFYDSPIRSHINDVY